MSSRPNLTDPALRRLRRRLTVAWSVAALVGAAAAAWTIYSATSAALTPPPVELGMVGL